MSPSLLTTENNLTFIHLNMSDNTSDNNTNIVVTAKRCRYKVIKAFYKLYVRHIF